MRGDIIARIPASNGQVIDSGGGQTFTVGPEPCNCGCKATLVLQGETDSFGFEELYLCQSCYEETTEQSRRYGQALDEQDREPKEGQLFLVATGDNMDRRYWCRSFRSSRAATAFLRQCDKAAEHCGGLYPYASARVQELPAETVIERLKKMRAQDDSDWDSSPWRLPGSIVSAAVTVQSEEGMRVSDDEDDWDWAVVIRKDA